MRILTRKKQKKIIEQILKAQDMVLQSEKFSLEEQAKIAQLLSSSCCELADLNTLNWIIDTMANKNTNYINKSNSKVMQWR